MEKYFMPLIIVVLLVSTAAVTAIGQDFINKNPDREICVKSRSCAINYMNNLEKEE
jgi:hypothetical protein